MERRRLGGNSSEAINAIVLRAGGSAGDAAVSAIAIYFLFLTRRRR
jgi:hypothetical protein